MPMAGEDLAGARQAVGTLLPLAVQASGGMRPEEDRHDYLTRVRQLAVDLWLETSAESETVRRVAELAACRTFPAVLLGVRVEPSTTRGVLTLRSWGPDGERQEEIRTDRTDDPRGVQTVELARGLVGHRVTVYKLEEPGRGAYQRYRCAKHLVDLGPADVAPAVLTPPTPTAPAAPAVPAPARDVASPGVPGSGVPEPGPDPAGARRAPARRAAASRRAGSPRPVRASGAGEPPASPAGPPGTDRPAAAAPLPAAAPTAAPTGTPGGDLPTAAPAVPPASASGGKARGAGGVPVERARQELLAAIGGDEEYRAAALHGIMRRAATDDGGAVVNVALLRMLAARTPEPDTAAGRKILADYRASAPAG